MRAIGVTSLELGGESLVRAEQPVNISIDYAAGRVGLHAVPPASGDATPRRVRVGAANGGTTLTFTPSDTPAEQEVALPAAAAARRAIVACLTSAAGPAEAPPETQAASIRPPLRAAEGAALWQEAWAYRGMHQPMPVAGVRAVGEDVVDLGREVELSEIRAAFRGKAFEPTPMPQPIWVAGETDGGPPAEGSPAWRRLAEEPAWRPSIVPGNYGRSEPLDDAFQTLTFDGVRARYVRARGAAELIYYDADAMASRRPLRLQVTDADGDDIPEVFVAPEVWPKFLRPRQEEDDAVALLDLNGRERFRRQARTNYQDAAVLDYAGRGDKQVVLTSVDGLIEVVDNEGRVVRTIDTYSMHQRFNEVEGRPNTRHPAGGLTMPYSLGLWRRGTDGTAAIVLGRYGAASFIDPSAAFEGVLMTGGYVTPMLLPHGIDFDGDGREEQLLMSRGTLWQIGGDPSPRVTEPTGHHFYPQIYQAKLLREPNWDSRIDGAPTIAMRPLTGLGHTQTLFVARENYLALYDGEKHAWHFTWVPQTKVLTAAAHADEGGRVSVAAATSDGLLWRLRWEGDLTAEPTFHTLTLGDRVEHVDLSPDGATLLIAGDEGLYLLRGEGDGAELARIAEGGFQHAVYVATDTVVAVGEDGTIHRFNRLP